MESNQEIYDFYKRTYPEEILVSTVTDKTKEYLLRCICGAGKRYFINDGETDLTTLRCSNCGKPYITASCHSGQPFAATFSLIKEQ